MDDKPHLFLTGDIHHMSLMTDDQRYLNTTEAKIAEKYVQIALNYGLKVTLFVTGKTCKEEPDHVRKLIEYENVEIGGHGWSAFKHLTLHNFWDVCFGSFCGPYWYQFKDVQRTIDIIKNTTGKPCVSWRGHALKYDKNTDKILFKNGVKIVSSMPDPEGQIGRTDAGLIEVPINIMPDHSYIFHAGVRKDGVPQSFWRKRVGKFLKRVGIHPFENQVYSAKEWLAQVTENLDLKLNKGGYALFLLHPSCMEIIDEMKTFDKFCRTVSGKGCKSTFLNELIN